MASRRDELRAHQFLRQRTVSALVAHETDPEQPPFRRPTFATYWGLVLALLGLALAGVIGLFDQGGPAQLQAGQTVIVENGTGARFVYLDGRLHPAANYASALLALGQHVGTQTVDSADLLGIPRGAPIGIAGAPDELPDAAHLLTGPWSMCSRPSATGTGSQVAVATMFVGGQPSGGTSATNRAVLVTAAGHEYLIWNGYRHRITDPRVVTAGLGLASESVLPVPAAWADTLPTGSDVAPIDIIQPGGRSRVLPSRPTARAGQLFVVSVGPGVRQFYVAGRDKLVPLTPFQLALQLAAPVTVRAYGAGAPQPIPLDASEVTLAVPPNPTSGAGDLPRDRPDFVSSATDATVCAVFAPGRAVPQLVVGPQLPDGQSELATGGAGAGGSPLADFVDVPAGRAALITVVASSTAAGGTLALVTDSGRLDPLASADVPPMLGYQDIAPARVAASVAARLPQGPALGPTAARSAG